MADERIINLELTVQEVALLAMCMSIAAAAGIGCDMRSDGLTELMFTQTDTLKKVMDLMHEQTFGYPSASDVEEWLAK